MPAPHTFARRILLAVTGLSPQIVTETVYALAVTATPAFLPTEIHILSTREGTNRARLSLLAGQPGWLEQLFNDYHLPREALAQTHIKVITTPDGHEIDDIRSPEDNVHCADFITNYVRHLTVDDQAALHVSIAGGRKTMGFFVGYALSLYGRPQDRLSHVLVSAPFESSWDFFYPAREERIIHVRNQPADASQAIVTLADMPFVSLRHGLPTALLEGTAGYEQTVNAARQALGPPRLVIDLAARCVTAGEVSFQLPPADLALLMIFARRAQAGQPGLPAPTKDVPDQDWARRYLDELQNIIGDMTDQDKTIQALRHGMDGNYFSQRKSKLQRKVRQALGAPMCQPYLVKQTKNAERAFYLDIDAHSIHIL